MRALRQDPKSTWSRNGRNTRRAATERAKCLGFAAVAAMLAGCGLATPALAANPLTMVIDITDDVPLACTFITGGIALPLGELGRTAQVMATTQYSASCSNTVQYTVTATGKNDGAGGDAWTHYLQNAAGDQIPYSIEVSFGYDNDVGLLRPIPKTDGPRFGPHDGDFSKTLIVTVPAARTPRKGGTYTDTLTLIMTW